MPLIPSLSRSLFLSHSLSFPRLFSSMSTSSVDCTKARLRGVVFDMDGTLTVPVIDFPAMYKAVLGEEAYLAIKRQNPCGIDILHHVENWCPEKQRRAYETIADFEKQGLDRLQIMPGASQLCEFLESRKIRRGLITRNVKASVDLFHERFGACVLLSSFLWIENVSCEFNFWAFTHKMTFCPALSREFRPCKPDPAPLLHICSTWEVQPYEIMMIGDSLKDDVACGKRAGALTCLLDETGRYDSPEYADVEFKPDYKIASLKRGIQNRKISLQLLIETEKT